MTCDATRLADWEIARTVEKGMPTPVEWIDRLGLEKDEIIPMGRVCRLDFLKVIERLKDRPDGRYIEVTAITPTPLGEGKSTTAIGLIQGLGKRRQNVGGCLRQPSGGPTMNVKGTAAGGGNALLIPMTDFSMGLTGDMNDVMNAHNLAMVALTARMQHERNYSDEQLLKLSKIRRLDIDPTRVEFTWVMDFCALVRRSVEALGVRCAIAEHWAKGREGALDLSDAVMDACREETSLRLLYPLEMKLRERVETIAQEIYGASGVAWTTEAQEKARMLESDPKYNEYATLMVKSHLSLSHDPNLKGVPRNWFLPIRDVLIFSGAKFLCPCAGAISLMPGTGSNLGFRKVDVDTSSGEVTGLF